MQVEQPEIDTTLIITIVIIVIVFLVAVFIFYLFLQFFRPWLKCFLSGCPVPFFVFAGMKLRGSPSAMLVEAYIARHHSKDPVSMAVLESCYVANPGKIHDAQTLLEHLPKFQASLESDNMMPS